MSQESTQPYMDEDEFIRFTGASPSQSSIVIAPSRHTRQDGNEQRYYVYKLQTTNTTEPSHQPSSSCGLKRKRGAASAKNNAPVSYHNFGPPSKTCSFCNATMWVEERNSKSSKSNPTFSTCCQEGKVRLEKLQETPSPLSQLLEYSDDPVAIQFQKKIRIYNAMFCFTSFGGRIDGSINQGRGPYSFRISGQNYHRFGSLIPTEGIQPRYSQLYFYDTEHEISNRMATANYDKELDESIVRKLIDMLDTNSCVAKAFRMARDWCRENSSLDLKIRLIGERQSARRQYNIPKVSEVAALIIGDFGKSNASRDIIVNSKASGLQKISELHPLYMTLQYPLLFPYGKDGFHENIAYHTNT